MKSISLRAVLTGLCVAVAVQLCACAKPVPPTVTQGTSKTQETKEEEEGGENKTVSEADIVGEWIMVYNTTRSQYQDEDPYEYITMADDPYAEQAEIKIRREGDSYIADYRASDEMSLSRFYGNRLEYDEAAAYDGCENDKWCYHFVMPYDDDPPRVITMTDADTLIEYEVLEESREATEEDEGYHYKVETISTFLRKDSPRLSNMEDLRYFDTVTVSNTKELLKNIKNNTKLILKEGTYNFSDIMNTVKNEHVDNEAGAYVFEDVSNLCIAAEEGSEVSITVNDPYSPVMSFTEGSYNIVLRGLTVGHDVEPGYCSGSVLDFNTVNGVSVEDCKLYGCGTYGIEAYACSNIEVKNTAIYECTYGLVSLIDADFVHFTDCQMRDSKEYSMFDINSSYDVVFEDCKIHDNDASSAFDGVFVSSDEYSDVTFRNCEFTGNSYLIFSNNPVTLEKCNITDSIREGGQG